MTTSLNYLVSGAQDAPLVTLAHGLATDLTMWDSLVAHLETRFRVLRYDARGHGRSPAPSDSYTLTELGEDVIDLLDELEIEKTHFVGLSMGGMVGMGLGLDHPDRIARLVVCDARGDAPQAYRRSWDDRIEKVAAGGIAAIVEPTLERWFTKGFKSDREAMDRMRSMVAGTSVEGYVGCARALRDLDYARRLPDMRVPTLYLVGSEDAGASPDTMRALAEATPGAAFAEVAPAGHISAVEQPEQVAAAIVDFIDGAQG